MTLTVTPIKYTSGHNGALGFTAPCPNMNLVANTPLSYTVPGPATQKYILTFEYESDHMVYVAYNATATVPSGGSVDANSVSEAKPHERYVYGGNVLSFITPNTSTNMGFSIRSIEG